MRGRRKERKKGRREGREAKGRRRRRKKERESPWSLVKSSLGKRNFSKLRFLRKRVPSPSYSGKGDTKD